MSTDTVRFERRVLILMALIQFINIWDFMIVMPLGPDFARALGIDIGHVGWIAGSYSISAAVVGVLSARYLDRFDRRSVLLFSLSGLMVSTFCMVFAQSFHQIMAVRVITGAFGGPVIASSLAVIADVFPPERRGEAMGKVFGSFSIAAVLGVPLGLEIARHFGWWAPFVAVAAVALVTVITIRAQLPPMRGHLAGQAQAVSIFRSLRRNPAMGYACILTATSLFGAFLLIPNISGHVQQNMGYPREWLGLLYFAGGSAAFFSMRYAGRQSDRIGYARTALYATCLLCFTVVIWFYLQLQAVPAVLMFILFMIASSTRNVTGNALTSRIPRPQERAGFMSLMSAVQHLFSGLGAACSTAMLTETADHRLEGMDRVALLAMVSFTIAPLVMYRIEKLIRNKRPDAPVMPVVDEMY